MFIYQLWILCFVTLLYAQYKVAVNSIWWSIKNRRRSATYFPDGFRCLTFILVKDFKRKSRSRALKMSKIRHDMF